MFNPESSKFVVIGMSVFSLDSKIPSIWKLMGLFDKKVCSSSKWYGTQINHYFYYSLGLLNHKFWLELFSKLRIHWRLSTILKTSNKSARSSVFLYKKVYIFWKFIQYTIHRDKTQMWKMFPWDKIKVIKNALFFLSQAPTHDSFTFNWQLL